MVLVDIQEEITRRAEAYDPEVEADAQASRALLQGALIGHAMHGLRDGPCRIERVEQDTDKQGNYLPYFTIITGAGHRIRISVEVEEA